MSKLLTSILLLSLWLGVLSPSVSGRVQVQLRSPIALGQGPLAGLATDGDLAVCVTSPGSGISASVSDGRGVEWGPALDLISGAPTIVDVYIGDEDPNDAVRVLGDEAWVGWNDNRNHVPEFKLDSFIARLPDGQPVQASQQVFNAEVQVPSPPDAGSVLTWDFEVGADSQLTGSNVYTIQSFTKDAALGVGKDSRVYVNRSTDGGSTFGSGVLLDLAPNFEIDYLDIDAEGANVYAAWICVSPLGDERVCLNVSHDYGATWLVSPIVLADSTGTDFWYRSIRIKSLGNYVGVSWSRTSTLGGSINLDRIEFRASSNAGTTFSPASLVDGVVSPQLFYDTDALDFDVDSTGRFIFCWDDNRSGSDQVYSAWTDDLGMSFTETQVSQGPKSGGARISLREDGSVDREVFLIWEQEEGFVRDAATSYSADGGVTFSPPQVVHLGTLGEGSRIVFNRLYSNLITASSVSQEAIEASGYRLQGLAVQGVVAGPTQIGFTYSGFSKGEASAFLLASKFLPTAKEGELKESEPLNRIVGISPFVTGGPLPLTGELVLDPVFSLSLSLPFTPLSLGAGQAISINGTLPPGITLYFVGIAIDPSSPTLIGRITDVVTTTT